MAGYTDEVARIAQRARDLGLVPRGSPDLYTAAQALAKVADNKDMLSALLEGVSENTARSLADMAGRPRQDIPKAPGMSAPLTQSAPTPRPSNPSPTEMFPGAAIPAAGNLLGGAAGATGQAIGGVNDAASGAATNWAAQGGIPGAVGRSGGLPSMPSFGGPAMFEAGVGPVDPEAAEKSKRGFADNFGSMISGLFNRGGDKGPQLTGGGVGPYDEKIKQEAAKHGLENDPLFLRVVNAGILAESGGDPYAENVSTEEESYGLFQMNRKGGAGQGHELDKLFDPNFQIENRVPRYAAVYKEVIQRRKDPIEVASEVNRRVQLPKDWQNETGAAAKNYIDAFSRLESPSAWEGKRVGTPGQTVVPKFDSAYARAIKAASGSDNFSDPRFESAIIEDIANLMASGQISDPYQAMVLMADVSTKFANNRGSDADREAANARVASQVGVQLQQLTESTRQFNEKQPWEIATITGVDPNGQPTFAARQHADQVRQQEQLLQFQFLEYLSKAAPGMSSSGTGYLSGFEPGGQIEQYAGRNNVPFQPITAPAPPTGAELNGSLGLLEKMLGGQ